MRQPSITTALGPRHRSIGLSSSPRCAALRPARRPAAVQTVPGMAPVPDPNNLYSETAAGKMSPNVAGALERIYVPNHMAHTVSVIDPATLKVTHTFKVGLYPQHVVPSWDLKTLYVANNAENSDKGSLTVVDPQTGKPGKTIPVDDPYNMYWTPDGKHAIVVAEAFKRLDFRDPQTMKLDYSIATPDCDGINHADFGIDGRIAFFTCEFNGSITKIDLVNRKVLGTIKLSRYFDRPEALALVKTSLKTPKYVPDPQQIGGQICITPGMPQDVRASPDGKMLLRRRHDGRRRARGRPRETFKQFGFIPDRRGRARPVPQPRRQAAVRGQPRQQLRARQAQGQGQRVGDRLRHRQGAGKTWPVPGGGSPDMGDVSADGKHLWLSGRYDDVVYRFDTGSGAVDFVAVGKQPHGLAVWPQPGRYSLGHTGNLR